MRICKQIYFYKIRTRYRVTVTFVNNKFYNQAGYIRAEGAAAWHRALSKLCDSSYAK
jgi:hypothetical protein